MAGVNKANGDDKLAKTLLDELGGSLYERFWYLSLPEIYACVFHGKDSRGPVVLIMDLLLFTTQLEGIPFRFIHAVVQPAPLGLHEG